MKVYEWLKIHPRPGVTVVEHADRDQVLAALLANANAREIYVVNDQQKVIGHISYHKIARLILAEHTPTHTRSQIMERVTCGCASEIMDSHFNAADPGQEMDEIFALHLDHLVEELPVLSTQGELVGVVCLRDVLKAYL